MIISGIGKRPFEIVEHQVIKPSVLLRKLADFGYEKVSQISRRGEFRFLGDALDIFPFKGAEAFRIEFFGNKIERIYSILIEQNSEGDIGKKISKTFFERIQAGDYLVHLDHGIGRFCEMRIIGNEKYFYLEYAKGDKLFVPESAAKKLTPYIGFGIPKISSLKGNGWLSIKRKVSEETVMLARTLLDLYAKRALAKRDPFIYDKFLDKEFAKRFNYQLTKEQLSAIEDIKRDLESSIPMDRLICGDVGFGKTEVALRAAFWVIGADKQVVLITPTTILADQHYRYIESRFKPFGISVSLISRASQKGINAKEDNSPSFSADILVGTHKLLYTLQRIKRMSLVIIDEEQKFGVKQKERFKELRANADILSLSATPIPRTFQLALAGLRDISLISTPLPGKEPIITTIHPFNPCIMREAIREELKRNGQIYYLVPRIKDIPFANELIKKFFPSLSIGIAHGRLKENELLFTLQKFREKKYDLLIATTIIENGLDLENVNTLIAQDAQKLGLSQAHQIRGRVGRRSVQASAYFFYNPRRITPEGKKRLLFLARFGGLGKNYEIAMKDLEIRGTGSILGKEQSGNIRAIGLHLYNEILREAVNALRVKRASQENR